MPQSLVDRLPAILWEGEPATWTFRYVSAAAERILGYPAEAWLDDPNFWSGHIHPDDHDWVMRFCTAKTARGLPHTFEYRFIAADGRTVWLQDTVRVEMENGRPVRFWGVMVDVTERRDAEEALKQSEAERASAAAMLDAAFSHAPVGLAFLDRDLRYVRVNERMAAFNGLPIESHLGRTVREVLPALADRIEPRLEWVLSTGESLEGLEFAAETQADPGRTRNWIVSYYPVAVTESSVVGVGVVALEVTERRRAEDALRWSEEKYRSLYSRTPIMMHSIDREGRLVSVSDAWLGVLGYERDEVIGRKSVDFLTPESREYARTSVLPKFFVEGQGRDVPYQFVKKNGEVIDVLLSATSERDETGEPARSLAVLVDVTDRNRTERALERSQELLRQAQKMEAIGRLAGGIAHDFNNILVAIIGHGELLLGELRDERLRAHVEQILRAGDRAASITKQILAFSRQQVLKPRVLNLNALIADTEKMLRRIIREDVEFVTNLSPSLGRVQVDPGQMVQVLMNLAANAGDAMPNGGRLVIETANVDLDEAFASSHPGVSAGPHAMLAVSDSGSGMTPEVQARIFEPFYTTKELGYGTGLGLSTVYGIVQQSAGCIEVESEIGRGTTFRVFLPRVGEAQVAARANGEAVLAGRGETILVAEDDAMVRDLLSSVLANSGYAVLVAAGPLEALAIAKERQEPIAVLLTDIVMPRMNGQELARRVVVLHPETKVIYMSGHMGPLDASVHPREDWPLLHKPFTTNDLLQRLRETLA